MNWRACLLGLTCAVAIASSAGGATSSVVVSVNVPSATSLTNNCRQQAGYRFGTVLPGTPAITATGSGACSFSFDSTNDTAMLRMYQRDQNSSAAMASLSPSVLDQDGGAGYNSTYELDMFDASNGYAGGNSGRLLRTTDGTTWSTVSTGLSMTIRGVLAQNATTVIAVGSSGILRSTTGGTSWTTVYNPGLTVHDIDMSGGTFWAVGDNGHIATSPDGVSWTPQASGSTADLQSVDALSSSIAVAAGGGHLLRYDGTSWTERFATDAGWDVSGWSATGLVVAAGNWGEIRRSTDGGVTWSAAMFGPSPGPADLGMTYRAVIVVSATEAYVAGSKGAILHSTTSGSSWTTSPSPTANAIRGLSRNPSGTRIFAVGGGELIADTPDGTSWTGRRRINSALFDVAALDGQTAYAVGAHGAIRRTSDGTTWSSPASPTAEHLWGVDIVTGGVGYAVGDNGSVLRTATGATWSAVTPTGAHMLRGVAAIDANTVVAVGDGGVIARSTDGGTTWTVSTPVAANLSSVSSHDRRVVAVGNAGTILTSLDYGATWTNRTSVSGTTVSLRDVSVANEDTIYAIAKYDNQSRRSTDGGATWQLWTNTGWGNGGYSVSALTDGTVFASVYSDATARSTDPSGTPSVVYFPNGQYSWAVAAVDANVAFIVGEDGGIAKTQQGNALNDYGGANTWGNATLPSMFGVCLQSVTGATSDWTPDASPPCTTSDGDPWRALPASTATAKVAHTTTSGASASVTVVWGIRPAENTPPGTYTATAQVEVIAPDA